MASRSPPPMSRRLSSTIWRDQRPELGVHVPPASPNKGSAHKFKPSRRMTTIRQGGDRPPNRSADPLSPVSQRRPPPRSSSSSSSFGRPFQTARRRGLDQSKAQKLTINADPSGTHYRSQGQGGVCQGSVARRTAAACNPPSEPNLGPDLQSKHKRKLAWEFACALAHAYLHQESDDPHRKNLHVGFPSQAEACGQPEWKRINNCTATATSSSTTTSAAAELHLLICQHSDVVCIDEVVNPTQAAEWFGDHFSSTAALVS